MAAPTIKPIDTAKYECKQSGYAFCPELPMRAMLYGPSGCKKPLSLKCAGFPKWPNWVNY